ncbi:rCG62090 [Rattus norvegicus]|uniref:RCG62090 n=1 Tax=Rattus norvegicus TaxID=10116 RepID=A6HB80_RAT|nr:rCG62090 [Rattus norvegicus]
MCLRSQHSGVSGRPIAMTLKPAWSIE